MTTYKKRPKSPEKQAKMDAFTSMARQLAGEIDENRRSPETVQRSHRAQALPGLERFSELNQILILTQCPDATEAYTFNGWRERGKCVRKGEQCIYIRAPRTREEDGERVLSGMRALPVFTQNQVEDLDGTKEEEEEDEQ